jgi:hypothetical protein
MVEWLKSEPLAWWHQVTFAGALVPRLRKAQELRPSRWQTEPEARSF